MSKHKTKASFLPHKIYAIIEEYDLTEDVGKVNWDAIRKRYKINDKG
ncbi:unnamed protein product, partial [marine sediment metagenome]